MKIIFLEFRRESGNLAANGTDVTFGIDGRWGPERTQMEIHDRVCELRNRPNSSYDEQLFVGYTIAGQSHYLDSNDVSVKMYDENPPDWHLAAMSTAEFENLCGACKEAGRTYDPDWHDSQNCWAAYRPDSTPAR